MNVVIVCDFAHVNGGAASVAIEEALGLAIAGINVTYFSGVGPIDPRLQQAGIQVICLDQQELKVQLKTGRTKISGAIQGVWNREAYRFFLALLTELDRYDTIIHFHAWSLALSPSLFYATAKRKYRIALTCHDYEINCPIRTLYNYKKSVLCQCKAMSLRCVCTACDKRGKIQKTYRVMRQILLLKLLRRNDMSLIYLTGLEKTIMERDLKLNCNGYVIRNPVNIYPFQDIKPHKNQQFIYMGRISKEKGIELFCEAVTKANVEAGVIGDGEELEQLKKQYPNITFHGWLSGSQKAAAVRKARCLVVSSLWIETGPLVVPELQCTYALPCIIPSQCGMAENVITDGTGVTYEIGNLDELVSCIVRCTDDSLIERMSDNCKKMDQTKYQRITHINSMQETYKRLLSS